LKDGQRRPRGENLKRWIELRATDDLFAVEVMRRFRLAH
jgi:hypothetical protein